MVSFQTAVKIGGIVLTILDSVISGVRRYQMSRSKVKPTKTELLPNEQALTPEEEADLDTFCREAASDVLREEDMRILRLLERARRDRKKVSSCEIDNEEKSS